VVQDSELEEMLAKAEALSSEFLRLRALAIVSLLRLTGKRRGEIAMLSLGDFKTSQRENGSENEFLEVTFTLENKRKGNVLQRQSTKALPTKDPLTAHIVEYLNYLRRLEPNPKWFLPQCKSVFGSSPLINCDEHIKGRQVFNIVRSLSESVWPHLLRETIAADVVEQDSSLLAAFKIQRHLDLERFETGFNYLKRFASDTITREQYTPS
jgi:integrase